MLAKINVKSAFHLLPVHSEYRHLSGMKWRGNIYNDHWIPFGLRLAPKLLIILANLLAWIIEKADVS